MSDFRLSRSWATPLTIGAFALMASTGALMFFHLDNGLQKTVHEWAGWLLLAAVAAHATANGLAFKRHLAPVGRGLAIVGAFVLVVAGSFVVPSGEPGPSTPAMAINAIGRAPIAQVAPLFGKTTAQARADLAAAGMALDSDNAPLLQAVGADREKMGLALRALAKKG